MILRSRIIHSSYTATRYARHAAAHARALRGRCVRAASLYGRLARAEVPARRPRATHSRLHSLLLPPLLVSRALENMREGATAGAECAACAPASSTTSVHAQGEEGGVRPPLPGEGRPGRRGYNGPRVSFPIANARQENFLYVARLLRPAPPPPVQRAAQRGPPGQPSLPPEAPAPPRGRRGARGARSIRARWARYIVWLYVCLWAGPSKQAYKPPGALQHSQGFSLPGER